MKVILAGKVVRFYWRREPKAPHIIYSRIFGGVRRRIPKPIREPAGYYGQHVKGRPQDFPRPDLKRWVTTFPEVWWFQVPGFRQGAPA